MHKKQTVTRLLCTMSVHIFWHKSSSIFIHVHKFCRLTNKSDEKMKFQKCSVQYISGALIPLACQLRINAEITYPMWAPHVYGFFYKNSDTLLTKRPCLFLLTSAPHWQWTSQELRGRALWLTEPFIQSLIRICRRDIRQFLPEFLLLWFLWIKLQVILL